MTHSTVIGSGGLLGSAMTAELRRRGLQPGTPRFDWTATGIEDAFTAELRQVAIDAERDDIGWVSFWCAGVGTVAAPPETHRSDLELFEAFTRAAERACEIAPGTVVLASSAGALYAGGNSWPATEDTPVAPTHEYGRSKQRQEAVLDALAERTPDDRIGTVSLRISNLYGPGQAAGKPQGLLSHLIRNALRRTPLSLYVPLETSRDYLYVSDAARMAVTTGLQAEPGQQLIRILAAERNHTVAQLLSLLGRLMRRRIAYLPTVNEQSDRQPPLLAFRSLHRQPATTARVSIEEGLHRTIDAVTAGLIA